MTFDLHLHNPLGVALAAIPALLNVGLLIIAVRNLPRDRTAQSFTMFLASLIAWQCFDVAVRSAGSMETAATLRAMLRMGQFLAIPAGVHLALRLTERDETANLGLVSVLLYGPSLLFQGCYEAGLLHEDLVQLPTWGWIARPDDSLLWAIMSGWFSLLALAMPALLASHLITVRDRTERFGAMRLVTLGIALPVIVGVGSEVALPLMGIQQVPITSTTLSFFSAASLVALLRYDLFRVNTIDVAQAAIATVSDPVIIASPRGRIVYSNAAAQRLHALPDGRDVSIEELFPPATRADFLAGPWARCVAGQGDASLELSLLRGDGSAVPVIASLAPLPIRPGVRGAVLVAHDVTPLRKAMEAVQEASRAKSHFLANMSHELRTPLNAIIGYAELLGEDSDEEISHDLQRIETSGRYLLGLINDVLDISKVESGKLDIRLERVEVDQLIAQLLNDAEVMCAARGNGFEWRGTSASVVLVDRMRLRQVLLNLLSNAAKFTHNGTVRMHWSTEAERVRIDVTDTGIGMNDEQVGRLFEPFSQVHKKDHATYGGTGLGLAISRRLCRTMGGDLLVRSSPGTGSTFTVWLARHAGDDDPTTESLAPISLSEGDATAEA